MQPDATRAMASPRDASLPWTMWIYLVMFVASLSAAGVLYGLLESTGTVTGKGAQLGGAAAGFAVVFMLSAHVFSKMLKSIHANQKDTELESSAATIRRLQATIDELVSANFAPTAVPAGFASHVSRDDGIAYAHPADWRSTEEKIIGQYIRQPLKVDGQPEGFTGNLTISCQTIPRLPVDQQGSQAAIDAVLDAGRDRVVAVYDAKNVTSERIMVAGFSGRRYRGDFVHFQSKLAVSFDNILLLEPGSSRVFVFSLYERTELVQAASAFLLTLVGTARIRVA